MDGDIHLLLYHGVMRLLLAGLGLLVILTSLPARATRVIQGEREVGGPPVLGPSDARQIRPRLACNPDGCLLLWIENMVGSASGPPPRVDVGRLWVTRLGPDGSQRDRTPLLFPEQVLDLDLATDGQTFVVVWTASASVGVHLKTMRIDGAGMGDVHSLPLPIGVLDWAPAVSFGGDRYLAVATQTPVMRGGEVQGVLLDRTGAFAGPLFPISGGTLTTGSRSAAVAFTGQRFVVAWPTMQAGAALVRGARVTVDGTVVDSGFEIAALARPSYQPRLAFGGGTLLLTAGPSGTGEPAGDIDAWQLDSDGKNPRRVALPASPGGAVEPHAAWNGSEFLVTWGATSPAGGRQVAAARLAPDGKLVAPEALVLGGNQSLASALRPRAAPLGAGFLLVFEDEASPPFHRLSRVTVGAGGTPGTATPAVITGNRQLFLGGAHAAGQTLLVWADERDGYQAATLLATRIGDDGAALDDQPLVIAKTTNEPLQVQVVESGGGGFTVVWQDVPSSSTRTFAARITAAGALAVAPVAVGNDVGPYMVVAAHDAGALLAWTTVQGGPNVRRLDGNLATVGPDLALDPVAGHGAPLAALGLGDSTMVVWDDTAGAAAARFVSDGAVIRLPAASVMPGPSQAALVSDGARVLLLWGRTVVVPLPRSGSLEPLAAAVTTPFSLVEHPSWDGAHYVDVVSEPYVSPSPSTLFFERRTPDGRPLAREPVVEAPESFFSPRAIGVGQGKTLLAYSRLVQGEDRATFRVRYQILDTTLQPADGGAPDAAPDAPALDAIAPDAIAPDVAPIPDATRDAPEQPSSGGCGCHLGQQPPGRSGSLLVAVMFIALVRRPRPRRRLR
jgi:hypothetical protein